MMNHKKKQQTEDVSPQDGPGVNKKYSPVYFSVTLHVIDPSEI